MEQIKMELARRVDKDEGVCGSGTDPDDVKDAITKVAGLDSDHLIHGTD